MSNSTDTIQIDRVPVETDSRREYLYQIAINHQDTPPVTLSELRELRDICDRLISETQS